MRQLRVLMLALILFVYGCVCVPETIKDIQDLPQDHMFYIDKSPSDRELVTHDEQQKMDVNYDVQYFAPWHREKAYFQIDVVERGFKKYKRNLGYGENGKRHKKSWMKRLAANAQLENYPNCGYTGITVDIADMRVLPTNRPRFYAPAYSHRGYPFDTFQESLISANTPVFITHISKDKAWLLAETPYVVGWIAARKVATVDKDFKKTWESGHYAVIVKDKIPLCDEEGRFLFKAPLGSIFPKIGEDPKGIKVLVATADKDGRAFLKTAIVSTEAATTKPLKLTNYNIAKMANELINEPYGWGGLYQNRDCSAMIKDLFASFGIWLPRHSTDQAKEGGTFIDLQQFSPQEKEQAIIKDGIPYLTLIWRKGHIMLYIGSYQGKALIFHNFWGIKTKDLLGREGRRIVGHAAITTLNPGLELRSDDSPDSYYISSIMGMTMLVSPKMSSSIQKTIRGIEK
ncbi:MAG: NlpC/P60 family N-terminal domain-containing protein [Syntrophaceae bacterium]